MIKIYCDRCGREILEPGDYGRIALYRKQEPDRSFELCNLCLYKFDKWMLDLKETKAEGMKDEPGNV